MKKLLTVWHLIQSLPLRPCPNPTPRPIPTRKVPEKYLFHPKDHVTTPASGPVSPAVLRCISALSEAVRKNACTEKPGDFYDGPLLGEFGRRSVRLEGGGAANVLSRGGKASRQDGRRGLGGGSFSSGGVGVGGNQIGNGNWSGNGSGGGIEGGNGNGNANRRGNGGANGIGYGSGNSNGISTGSSDGNDSGSGNGNGIGHGNLSRNGSGNHSAMVTQKAEEVGEETPTSPDSTLSGVGSIGRGA